MSNFTNMYIHALELCKLLTLHFFTQWDVLNKLNKIDFLTNHFNTFELHKSVLNVLKLIRKEVDQEKHFMKSFQDNSSYIFSIKRMKMIQLTITALNYY